MGNNKSPATSMDAVALLEKDPSISEDDKQSHSPVPSFIENPALVLDLRLLTLESSTTPTEIASQTPKPKNICDLPIDVLVHLADSLPPDIAALLSISCKAIWCTLGSKYVQALNKPYRVISLPVHAMYTRNPNIRLYRGYRYNFLRLLARGLPNHITCYSCNKLHIIDLTYGQGLRLKECAYRVDNILPLLKGYASFHVLQAAMKRYHQNRSSLSLSLYDGINTFLSGISQLVEHSRETILISQTTNSLIFRTQRIVLLPANHQYPFYKTSSVTTPTPTSWDHPVCPHLKWDCFYDFRARKLSVSDRSLKSPRFQSCDYCMTDCHVAVQDRKEEGDALYLTRWQDLGSGESARNFNWQNAIANVRSQDMQGKDKVSRYQYEHGSVCEAFEGVPGEKYEFGKSMTQQDWKVVNKHLVSKARHVQRRGKEEKKLPLIIRTVRDNDMVRSWFE